MYYIILKSLSFTNKVPFTNDKNILNKFCKDRNIDNKYIIKIPDESFKVLSKNNLLFDKYNLEDILLYDDSIYLTQTEFDYLYQEYDNLYIKLKRNIKNTSKLLEFIEGNEADELVKKLDKFLNKYLKDSNDYSVSYNFTNNMIKTKKFIKKALKNIYKEKYYGHQ